MLKEAWEALRAAILLSSELKRQREDTLRILTLVRELAAENEALRARIARLEKAHAKTETELRAELLSRLRQPDLLRLTFRPEPAANGTPRSRDRRAEQ